MSGEYFGVVLGIGEDIKYRLFNSEKEARSDAADAIHSGTASQVAVEENKRGEWVRSETRAKRNVNSN